MISICFCVSYLSSFHYHGLTDLYQTTAKRIKAQAIWDPFR